MSTSRRTWAMGLLIIGLVLAGCSGDDDGASDAPGTASDGAGSVTADPGGGESGGGAQAPDLEGLTVPLPPAAEAVSTFESGPATIVQFIVPLDEQQTTISFYDDWTSSQPDDYQRLDAGSGGVTWQNAPAAGMEKRIIAVLSPLEGDDFVTVTLTVGPAE